MDLPPSWQILAYKRLFHAQSTGKFKVFYRTKYHISATVVHNFLEWKIFRNITFLFSVLEKNYLRKSFFSFKIHI